MHVMYCTFIFIYIQFLGLKTALTIIHMIYVYIYIYLYVYLYVYIYILQCWDVIIFYSVWAMISSIIWAPRHVILSFNHLRLGFLRCSRPPPHAKQKKKTQKFPNSWWIAKNETIWSSICWRSRCFMTQLHLLEASTGGISLAAKSETSKWGTAEIREPCLCIPQNYIYIFIYMHVNILI